MISCFAGSCVLADESTFIKPSAIVPVWPGQPPAWNAPSEAERDTTKPDGRMQAGQRVIRLGNVSTPQMHVYHPASGPSETVVLVCPGGGYSILAWDLEGTEIAQWLSGVGATAIVVKYRVPTRSEEERWLAPVQDIQRCVSAVRSGAIKGVSPKQVGVLGFSAGGNASSRVALAPRRHYEPIDDLDKSSPTPDFAVLVYPAWLNQKDSTELIDELSVNEDSPQMFLAHAADDRISALSSVAVYSALHLHKVPASLHVFASGGHGFGGRIAGDPTDAWRDLCQTWMEDRGWLAR